MEAGFGHIQFNVDLKT